MTNSTRIYSRFLIFASVILLLSSLVTADCMAAGSKKAKKAKQVYASYLASHLPPKISDKNYYDAAYVSSNKTGVTCYMIHDLDKDKVPELITYTPINVRWFIIRIFTCKNGKVVPLKMENGADAVFDDCATANGSYSYYICKKGHFHNRYAGYFDTFDEAYKVTKGKMKLISTGSAAHKEKKVAVKSNNVANRNKLRKK